MDLHAAEAALRQQESLREVIEAISSELELRVLLTKIVLYACTLLDAQRGTIGLVVDGQMKTEAVFNMPDGELGTMAPLGVGLAGQVLAAGQPVRLQRYGDVSEPLGTDLLEDAVLGCPIDWHGETIGFFGVGAKAPRQFNEQDMETLSTFARHAAVAIVNAQLFEREQRRLARATAMTRIGSLMTSSLSLEEVLQTTVDAIHQTLHYNTIDIFLIDENDPESLVLRARSGIDVDIRPGEFSLRCGEGNVGRAAQLRTPIYSPDTSQDPNYIPVPGAEHLSSELALPIIASGQMVGVLNVEAENRISQDDTEGLEVISSQLAAAITNAQLFAKTEETLSEIQLLYETSRRMSSALDIHEVVEAYLEQVALQRRHSCTVFIFDHDAAGKRKEIILLGRWRPEEGVSYPHATHPYFHDDFDDILDAGQVVTITDVATDPRASDQLKNNQLTAGRPALALIPLIVRGRRIGGVSLNHTSCYAWQKTDLRPYQVTAAQLAIALESRQQQHLLAEQEQRLAVAEERRRLSRELHDSVTQILFGMTLVAQSVGPAMKKDVAEGEARVAKMLSLAQQARAEMRALLVELRSPTTYHHLSDTERLARDGLVATLQHVTQQLASTQTPRLEIVLEAACYSSQPAQVEAALLRIVQEALNNTIKHAGASQVIISLEVTDICLVSIRDNGRGFTVSEDTPADVTLGGRKVARPHKQPSGTATKPSHFGLDTMRERAEAIGGVLTVSSSLGKGTHVRVVAPAQASRKDSKLT
ncbi:MAG: GAF domain-containing protein [Deinococcota bacterium]